ncbi:MULTISPECIES: DUF3817 domain-containing protein [Kocuria]|uniref:DUF3817 domain-containing protein n=1 Tax=Kocuria TaxID=57493 RepID=UPI0013953A04|nr:MULTISPECIES: DUF3817 domain-containing protein [Kocuria]MCT1545551.1 DUF3817 domain-containing protein [Kocuria rhizophila]MCT2171533.1 DUF3817 domain-containing protein [Kocuria rhizophila]MDN3461960.1 DUF3817 domain-containing protein [Kocuria sp. APC 4018]MXN63230.1 DUF3817 domain-containing protein [Bacillus sp. BGMRC0062]
MSPRKLYRTAATAEAVTWTLLILGMIAKYVFHAGDLPVRIGGGIHGFVFLSYCVATVVVWTDRRWPASTGVVGLLLSVVPFATVPFERHVERKGLLSDSWRVAPAGTLPADDAARQAASHAAPQRGAGTVGAESTPAASVEAAGREPARTPAEKLLAVILRWPVLSGLALLVFVVLLFMVLLTAGPPTQWFD